MVGTGERCTQWREEKRVCHDHPSDEPSGPGWPIYTKPVAGTNKKCVCVCECEKEGGRKKKKTTLKRQKQTLVATHLTARHQSWSLF